MEEMTKKAEGQAVAGPGESRPCIGRWHCRPWLRILLGVVVLAFVFCAGIHVGRSGDRRFAERGYRHFRQPRYETVNRGDYFYRNFGGGMMGGAMMYSGGYQSGGYRFNRQLAPQDQVAPPNPAAPAPVQAPKAPAPNGTKQQ